MRVKPTIMVKRPGACSEKEIDAFAAFVRAGNETAEHGLERRIGRARNLVFLLAGGCLEGIAAVKTPAPSYHAHVFGKAAAAQRMADFPLEFGWLFVEPGARGRGHGHRLLAVALDLAAGAGLFATAREDNAAMRHLAEAHGLVAMGRPFRSLRGDYRLALYGSGGHVEEQELGVL